MNAHLSLRLFVACVLTCAVLRTTAAADPVAQPFGGLKYRPIGPAISGGRTTAVAGSDTDPRVYYAGGADGGVFRSDDGGISWHAIFDRAGAAAIGAIAVSAAHPNDVWVGTGESNPRNDVQEGSGVWHSVDGGAKWTHAGLDDAGSVSSISIDPRDPKRVVVGVLGHIFRDGTMRGIYLTRDGGAHWSRTLYVGPSSGVSQVVRVPDRPGTLFAGVWQLRRRPWIMTSGGPLGGLYRSDDGGATWRKLTGHGLPSGLTGRIGIASATGGRIYTIVQSKQGDIWRSDDGGERWKAAPHSPYVGARPFYFSNIYVDPADRNALIAVALILSISKNGAWSFNRTATNAGWDYHAAWWSADGRRIIVGSDEGVIMSSDGAKHWWQPYDVPFSQPYHVAFDDANPNYNVCVGLQDNYSWCGPGSTSNAVGVLNRDWYIVGPGDGMHALFDPKDKNFIWQTSTNSGTGQVFLYDARTTQTLDVSPAARLGDVKPADLEHRFNWDTPIAFTHDGAALVGGEVVFSSSDHGLHWDVLSPDLTRNDRSHQQISGGPITQDASGAETYDTLLCIAPSKLDGNVIWTGSDDGLVHVTRDAGKTWTDVTPSGAPHWGRAYTVEPSGANAGTAYVAFDDHMLGDERPYIFATADYGKTWSSLGAGLPAADFVRVVREDPKNPRVLYAGTQRGIFVSLDAGTSWKSLRLNMPASAIYDLQIQPQRNDLIAASHGRGVWILDDLTPIQTYGGTNSGAVLFAPPDAYRMWQTAPVSTFTEQSIPDGEFVGENREQALFSYYLPAPAHQVEIDIAGADGHVVKHLRGKKITGHAGVNRTGWDLTEDGPVRWMGTFEQNRGPSEGPEVVPETYMVRLIVDGATKEAPLVVKGDPREPGFGNDGGCVSTRSLTPLVKPGSCRTPGVARASQRHGALVTLNTELSSVDTWLNEIDAARKAGAAQASTKFSAFRTELTMDPQNVEDLRATPGLRERILDLLLRISSSSYQAPTDIQAREMTKLATMFAASSAEAKTLGL